MEHLRRSGRQFRLVAGLTSHGSICSMITPAARATTVHPAPHARNRAIRDGFRSPAGWSVLPVGFLGPLGQGAGTLFRPVGRLAHLVRLRALRTAASRRNLVGWAG